MKISELLLTEFNQEFNTTRKFLERIPEDKLDWRPHEKSLTVGQLGLHMAAMLSGIVQMAREQVAAFPDFSRGNPQPKAAAEILGALEDGKGVVEQYLSSLTDEECFSNWTVTAGGKELFTIPRYMMLRSILLNHWYHHRGQLGVYLRMLGAKVPSSYGPSGDEMPEFAS